MEVHYEEVRSKGLRPQTGAGRAREKSSNPPVTRVDLPQGLQVTRKEAEYFTEQQFLLMAQLLGLEFGGSMRNLQSDLRQLLSDCSNNVATLFEGLQRSAMHRAEHLAFQHK